MTLLFILLGWTERAKYNSPSYWGECRNCGNGCWYHPVKTRRWFVLLGYFIFPMGLSNYFVMCDVCQKHYVVDKGKFRLAKDLIPYTSQYIHEEITHEEWDAILSKKIDESDHTNMAADIEEVPEDVPEETSEDTPDKRSDRGFH